MSMDMASEADPATPPAEGVRNVDEEAFEPERYEVAFPALQTESRNSAGGIQANEPVSWSNKLFVRRSISTQVFTVPVEERRFRDLNEHSFGDEGEQAKICKDIMAKCGVTIEMSLAKDQSLTVVIHGKAEAVMKARRELVTRLQTQAHLSIKIPREHHGFILGRSGKKLQNLELETATKISIPRSDENSDMIRIAGTKEGIDKARHEIQCLSDEQAKLAFERLPVPKIYHPFCCGPNNQIIKQLMEETGARINVPPLSVMKDEIVISGEKEAVARCKEVIMNTYEEKRRKCQTVSVEVRKLQHKYVIGPRGANIQEILNTTDVSVEVPSFDSTSETITLRGEQEKLGTALTMVYSKANSVIFSEVIAASWLHRFIIGKGGENVRKITENFPKVHIEFHEGQDKILVEGPPEEVNEAVKLLEVKVKELQNRMDFAEIEIEPKLHKHIIGKAGVNVTKIKKATGVAIRIPSDSANSSIIRIEGEPKGVQIAKQQLLEMAARMENEKSRDIIIEQRFHRSIIGAKGENIKEIRDRFNQVQITFPDPGKKSDVVTLRGPKNDVDQGFKYLQHYHQDLIVNNYVAQVHIFKGFHKNIIGKGGANIKKIRDETDTKIDLPNETSDSDVIVITGKKAGVEAAKIKIEAIQKDLANIKEITIEIPHKMHNSIIGAKGRLIRAIMDECGGVIIRFPPEGSNSDKVTLRGPQDDLDNAKKQVMELVNEKQISGFTNELHAKAEYHKFLIGRGGVNIRRVREKTGARIIFPSDQDPEDVITIIGKKESVEQAKAELEGLIKNLDNIVEGELNVDPRHHRHFVARRGEVLRQIADDYGGVTVSFPRSGMKSERVVLKGSKDCVEGAKKRIQEIVADLEAQVTIECVISQKYHRTVMGAKGVKVQEITKVYEVGVKFPDRPVNNPAANENRDNVEEPLSNGDINSDIPNRSDIIIITGKPENCEAAKAALQALVPITKEVCVPFDFHRFIIGQKGHEVRRMMDDFDVNISVPRAEEQSDVISVTGAPTNVENARAALVQKVEDLEKEKEDKQLRSFKRTVDVDPSYHPKIIGRKGAVISRIRMDNDVVIQFPEKGDPSQQVITITGYEENTAKAKDDILKIVRDLEEMTQLEVKIDHRLHPRIIGAKGRGIHRLTEEFHVDIRFPRADAPDPDIIVISGNEDDCLDCRDHLLNTEEEFLQDVMDQEYLHRLQSPPSRHGPNRGGRDDNPRGFMVRDAPWDRVPDTTSTTEFPSFGDSMAAPPPVKSNKAWGPIRKH